MGTLNCLDSSHMVADCYWLLKKILEFTTRNERDPVLFSDSARQNTPLYVDNNKLPSRTTDVNFSVYSNVVGKELICEHDSRFEVWGTKGYNLPAKGTNRRLPAYPVNDMGTGLNFTIETPVWLTSNSAQKNGDSLGNKYWSSLVCASDCFHNCVAGGGEDLAQPHFVLFPFMAQGHMIPMIDIARLLAQRGVIITILTTHLNANRFKKVIDRAIETGLKIQVVHLYFPSVEAGLPEGCENFDMLPSMDLGVKFFDATRRLQPQVEEMLEELKPSPSCLISDMCFPWTTNVAKKFNFPRIVFHGTCCFSLLCLHNLRGSEELEKIESDTEYFQVPGLFDKVELNKAQLANFVRPSDEDMKEIMDQMKKAEDEAYGIVVNSFEDLEQKYINGLKNAKGMKIWTIGPVSLCNKDKQDKAERGNKAAIDEHQCLKWLDSWEQDSALFVCLGSLSRLSTSQMIELALGLESSKRPFIWAVRYMSEEFKKWLVEENFEERVKGQGLLIHGWAPQVLILSHPSVGAFLTHCGWNSSLEGISAGMPMITWPMFAEQFCNERLIVNVLKTGVRGDMENPVVFGEEEKLGTQVSKEDIKMVIEEVMGEEMEAKMRRKRAKELGEKAKMAVEEGGTSHLNLTQLIQDVREQANLGDN